MKRFLLSTMILGVLASPGVFAQDTTQPAPTPATKKQSRVHKRREDQQARIAQGVSSGQLTPKETAHIENKEAKLNNTIREDREDHGGKLTKAEKKNINRRQNQVSEDIYNQKHDAQKQQ